jgi:hypothetical protein
VNRRKKRVIPAPNPPLSPACGYVFTLRGTTIGVEDRRFKDLRSLLPYDCGSWWLGIDPVVEQGKGRGREGNVI